MSDKIKDYIVIVTFALIIFGTLLINTVTPDSTFSKSERRNDLQQFPKLSFKTIFEKNDEKTFMKLFENYTSDQFVGRDAYRRLKASIVFNVFRHSDNNDIYIVDGQVSEYKSKLNNYIINNVIKGYNVLYDSKLKNSSNVYFSIVPDKNYYLAAQNGYPSINYDGLAEKFKNELNSNIKYIDLTDSLSANDFYATDSHWRQERLEGVVNKLSAEMNFKTGIAKYEENKLEGFYGVYYGRSALPMNPEELIYYTINDNEGITVKLSTDGKNFKKVDMYSLEKYADTNGDPYDIFLHGVQPFVVIENQNANSNKELVIFRDSYSSSLAPLLVESYQKITLIDLRGFPSLYIPDELLNIHENTDILILNSVEVLNSGTQKLFDENGKLIN